MSLRSWTRSPIRTLTHTLRNSRDGRRPRGRRAGPRGWHVSEPLEQRCLFATLTGGDTFEFITQSGAGGGGGGGAVGDTWVRIRLEGNIQAEFLGAQVSL